MKEYSKDPRITEFMDMPCKCGCGRWHELNDGYRSRGVNRTLVCGVCHQIEELEEEIEDIEYEMGCGNTKKREGKAEIKKLRLRIEQLENQEDD